MNQSKIRETTCAHVALSPYAEPNKEISNVFASSSRYLHVSREQCWMLDSGYSILSDRLGQAVLRWDHPRQQLNRLTRTLPGNTISNVGKVIRRCAVRLSLAILLAIGILLGVLAVLERDWGRLRGFEFLGSPDLVMHRDTGRSPWKMTRYYYSFEADVNDVCAKADAGLAAMDIVSRQEFTEQPPRGSRYVLKGKGPGEWITVSITDGRKLSAHSISKLSQSPSLDHRNMYDREKGCVAVTVTRAQPRLWPPRYLLQRLKVRLGAAANPPYPGE